MGAAHARDRRREHSRQPGGARRDARASPTAWALFHRGQLRVDGCRARRAQGRHIRPPVNTFSSSSRTTSRPWKAAWCTTDDASSIELVRVDARARLDARPARRTPRIFEKRDDDFYEAYRFILPGYNVRPIEMSGAIGVEQLKKLPAMTAAAAQELGAVPEAVRGRQPFHHSARERQELGLLFHDHAQSRSRADRARAIMQALKEADIGYRIITGGCITAPRRDQAL